MSCGNALRDIKNVFRVLGLKDIEIIAQCVLFFLAGFETTASTLSYFAHCMALNPEVQEKLYEQIESVLGQVRLISLSSKFSQEIKNLSMNDKCNL